AARAPPGLAGEGAWQYGLGHQVAVPDHPEPGRAGHHPDDRVAVDIAQLMRGDRAERQGEHNARPGESSDQFPFHLLVHRAVSFLGSGAFAPMPNEWAKPSSASSSTESFR